MKLQTLTPYCIVVCLGILCGCSSAPVEKDSALSGNITRQDVSNALQQVRSSQAYILQPGDLVDIKVYMEDNMDRVLRLSGNGTVTFPLVGNIKLSGLTLEQAEQKLANRLTEYIRQPQVSMLVKEYGNKTVYVLGQVSRPAAIQIPPEKQLTVLEAITSVGGFTDIANTSKVRVLRVEDGKQKTIDVDVSQITKQGNKSMDIALRPGDVIFVPQSMF
ncbi:MAG: polysaccharide export protein [Elusimicrobiaceae bacterium]|nr:polysaccharide export protein [Elusimicrobiaceae bacterium]